MAKTDKTFPIRMENETYRRLEVQAQRFGTSVTAYIRQSFVMRLERDEATMQLAPDHRWHERNGARVEIVPERTERHDAQEAVELPKSPTTAVRSWFDRLTVGGRKE